jgi:conjugal transfer pilus assembly protein TraE
MRISDYLATLKGVQSQNLWQRSAIVGLGITNSVTALVLLLHPTPVILVPPTLPGEVEIARNQGSGSLKESWGLYLAELLGNVTPGNAAFIERSLGPLLDARIYPEVMAILATEVEALRVDRVSVRFKSREVLYDATLDRVFVSGEQTSQGPGSAPESRPRTYEFRIVFRHYRPVVEHIDVYPGEPHLKDVTHAPEEGATQPRTPT